jgi:hypothetical protein
MVTSGEKLEEEGGGPAVVVAPMLLLPPVLTADVVTVGMIDDELDRAEEATDVDALAELITELLPPPVPSVDVMGVEYEVEEDEGYDAYPLS